MKIAHVTDTFAVSPQPDPEDIQAIAAAGFHTIICNCPDAEDAGQPTAETMRKAVEAAGLVFHHIPVSGGEFPQNAVSAFGKIRNQVDGKVLAYCRTGTRSITLDALANIRGQSADERIGQAHRAGYDLSGMRGRFDQ